MSDSNPQGFLSVEVKSQPVVAGLAATINLIIRNPFLEDVIVESIDAPSSVLLVPSRKLSNKPEDEINKSKLSKILNYFFSKFRFKEVSFGPLRAEFPDNSGRMFSFNMEPESEINIKTQLGPYDHIHVNHATGAKLFIEKPDVADVDQTESHSERKISAQQEHLASFEIKTASWLLVKPKVLELHALIKYRIGTQARSQVIPVAISIQPPVKSIIIGSVSGSVLGFLARQLNSGLPVASLLAINMLISILGIIIMASILAVVLSRQESSKGFVTLEDFYGAFVVGAILGYTGTKYFDNIITSTGGVS